MDSLVISSVNITKEDLIRISDMLQPYDVLRTEIFLKCLGRNLELEDIRNIKERGLPDEIQIDADLYDKMYKDYEDKFKDSALQHKPLFHLTGVRITKLKLNHKNQVILIWYTKSLVNGSIGIFGADYLDMKSRMDWCKQSMIAMMGIPVFATNLDNRKVVPDVIDSYTSKDFNNDMLSLLNDDKQENKDNV